METGENKIQQNDDVIRIAVDDKANLYIQAKGEGEGEDAR